ncbi:flagellar biosynthetic protein FliO [Labrenzia sp. PHM005]|uniref:flagellar biosynthetic protein FliO n=1 Tax=Labrenzia sp. PHM005 TaxID=2590016 RepID=UPI0011403AF0|nr:flagellar biosynthetic protein FliO [Labrenzia sp. PHM005]QDG76824.1 hypothetical protein FJ695_13595 [Labrenzia sp. PHM005]
MYNWIQTTFQVSEGLAQGLQLVISLAVVLVLFGLFIFIIKRLMGARVPQSRGRQPRIALMDSAAIDSRRRLLLVRRDNIEHLILVGGPSDVVVEQNIVRNAPLAAGQPRSGAYQTPQQAGAIKAALAPGPDIPLTPDDVAAAPPAGPSTDAPAAALPPQPSASTPPSSASVKPPAQTPVSTAADSPTPKPAAFGSSIRPSMGATSATSTSSVSRTEKPPLASGTSPSAKGKTASFSAPRVSAPRSAHGATSAKPETSKTDVAAPSIKNESEKAPKKSNPLRSLTRSFSPKDRPSYGSGKISPPASGPAARVTTAVVNPADTDPQASRVEPVVSNAGLSGSVSVSVPDKASPETNASPTTGNTSPSPASVEAENGAAGKDKSGLTDAMAEGIEMELFSKTKPSTADTPTAPQNAEQASEEKPNDPVAATPSEAQIDTQETAKPDTPSENAAQSGDDQKPVGGAANSDPDSEKGIGDRNPIEAEMAKILDELGGQPKQ